MHNEPGIVEGAKIALSVVTAAGAVAYTAKLALKTVRKDGFSALLVRSVITTMLVFCFFEVLPHHPIGVSEVHMIFGSTLFLMFSIVPAAIGLALGLLVQGVFLAPFDFPQYGMNLTTLLVPLMAVGEIARRIVPENTAYKDVKYAQCLALSSAYQTGIVAWVSFWAFYGQGFGAENLASVGSFGLAYMSVIFIEPLLDMAVLGAAKGVHQLQNSKLFHQRFYRAAS